MLRELLGRTANIKGEDVVDPVHNFEEEGGPVGESVRAGMVRWAGRECRAASLPPSVPTSPLLSHTTPTTTARLTT